MTDLPKLPRPVPLADLAKPRARELLAATEVIIGVDPDTDEQRIFHGKRLIENVVDVGLDVQAHVMTIEVRFHTGDEEVATAAVRDIKGRSDYSPSDRFPEILVESATKPKPLLKAVRRAVREVREQHVSLLPRYQMLFFRHARRDGFAAAFAQLDRAAERAGDSDPAVPVERAATFFQLGDVIQARLPSDLTVPWRTMDLLFGHPEPNQMFIRFRTLEEGTWIRNGVREPFYFSRRRPAIVCQADRVKRTVAFSMHALERICERTVGDWRTFAGQGDVFGFVENCVYYPERPSFAGADAAFLLFQKCDPPFHSQRMLLGILGNVEQGQNYYYLVGYCPVRFYGAYAIAVTLLVPGMDGTPERLVINSLPEPTRTIMHHKLSSQIKFTNTSDPGIWELLKRFHNEVTPQIVTIDKPVFEYD